MLGLLIYWEKDFLHITHNIRINTFFGKVTFQNENALITNYSNNKVDVFFQNNELIERLLEYDSEHKFLKTSAVDIDRHFSWSRFTFHKMLRKTNHKSVLCAPRCPKCRTDMVSRTTRWGSYVWGCQNFMEKDKDCREMIVLGKLPINVTEDDSCHFCDGKLNFFMMKKYIVIVAIIQYE